MAVLHDEIQPWGASVTRESQDLARVIGDRYHHNDRFSRNILFFGKAE